MSAGSKNCDGQENSTCAVMETSMLEEEDYFNPPTSSEAGTSVAKGKKLLENLCRVCAHTSDYFIPIFENEGIEHQLDMKIHQYLPIQLIEADGLPTHLCLQCASTLIAWHDLVTACVEADKRLHLLLLQADDDNEGHEEEVIQYYDPPVDSDGGEEISEPSTSATVVPVKESSPSQKRRTAVKVKQQRKAHENTSSESNVKSGAIPVAIKDASTTPKEMVESSSSAERCPATQSETSQPKEEYFPHSVHIKSEVSISEDVYPMCPHCYKTMVSNGELATHLTSFHSDVAYHCEKCDQIFFSNKKQFTVHVTCHETGCKNETIVKQSILNTKTLGRKFLLCDVCGKCFSRRFDLQRHQKTHATDSISNEHINESFVCVLCGKLFPEKEILQHIQVAHGSYSETKKLQESENPQNSNRMVKRILFDINNESSNFDGGNEISKSVCHLKSANKGRFLCDVCNKTYTRKYDMLRHWKKHTKEEIEKAEYGGVLVDEDGDSSYLFRHTKVSGNGSVVAEFDKTAVVTVGQVSLYRCSYCSKHFPSRYLFVRHLRIHTGEKPFTCHICGKQFRVSVLLNRHIRDVHEGIKKYPCDICGRKFANSHSRNDHRRIHTGERPCVCHLCGKAFKTKASLFVHNKFHVDIFPHKCPHCDQGFRMRQQLNVHILLHTGEKPHICQFCKKSFRLSKTLKDHIAIHTNNETFECSECGKRFSQERYLKNHIRAHKKLRFSTKKILQD